MVERRKFNVVSSDVVDDVDGVEGCFRIEYSQLISNGLDMLDRVRYWEDIMGIGLIGSRDINNRIIIEMDKRHLPTNSRGET